MEEILLNAIHLLLNQINQSEVVDDILLIEVDWGNLVNDPTDTITSIKFQTVDWTMVYTQSEMVLRMALSKAKNEHVIVVYHAQNGFQLPLDIRSRAHNKMPYRLGLRHRLAAITQRDWPPEVDYIDWRPSVMANLDDLIRLTGGVDLHIWSITRSDLEQLLIQSGFGLKIQGQKPQQILAELFTIQRRLPIAPDVLILSLLQEQLRQQSVENRDILAWAAEKPNRAEEILRTGLMMAAEQAASLMPNWAGLNPLRALLVNERKISEKQAITLVSDLATSTIGYLHPSTRQSILKAAQDALESVLPSEAYNPWFPALLEKESMRIAERLAVRDAASVGSTRRLEDHICASEYRARLDALNQMEMLVNRWQKQIDRIKSNTNVAEWAAWYAEYGSPLDLSALRLMNALGQGIGLETPLLNLLQSFWDWRDQCNKKFATSYISSYETAIHDRKVGIYGTHRLFSWEVRPRLQSGQKVLLIVMDGMSYPDYYQLNEQWAKKTPGVYGQFLGPKLSLLPSITSVSRKALFLNSLPTDRFDDEETYEKKAAISEAQALKDVFPDFRVQLFNKTNWDDQQIFNNLQFQQTDLLVVIINSIDDDLKNAATTVRLPGLEDLGSLSQIVRKGIESGWQVIITSDHGHTWHRDKKLRRGEAQQGAGERFIFLTGGQIAPDDAIETKDPHILYEPNEKRMALLSAWGSYFGHNPRRGYHGGASLEEVIIPCVRLTFEVPTKTEQQEAVSELTTQSSNEVGYDLNGVVLTLPDRRMVTLTLPFTLTPIEMKLLQALAHFGEASEAQLKQSVGSRRISGPISNLLDRMAAAGFDLIENKGEGPDGVKYRFKLELIK